MTKVNIKSGDFSSLAKHYSKNRPDYSLSVLNRLANLLSKPMKEIDFVDVGAGTGIWTRMVYQKGVKSAIAVEPNEDMRFNGRSETRDLSIRWIKGTAEQLDLPDASQDWITMASSFHWANFDVATREFNRVLRPGGHFTALWNPRLVGNNPLLLEIESYLQTIAPNIKRISSGLSGITETLSKRLNESPYFENTTYLEGHHEVIMKPDRYINVWKSVNDLRVQLGPKKFAKFLDFVQKRLINVSEIEATYLTRAWTASRSD